MHAWAACRDCRAPVAACRCAARRPTARHGQARLRAADPRGIRHRHRCPVGLRSGLTDRVAVCPLAVRPARPPARPTDRPRLPEPRPAGRAQQHIKHGQYSQHCQYTASTQPAYSIQQALASWPAVHYQVDINNKPECGTTWTSRQIRYRLVPTYVQNKTKYFFLGNTWLCHWRRFSLLCAVTLHERGA